MTADSTAPVSSMTTSITGVGFVDLVGARSVMVSVQCALKTGSATPNNNGVTLYTDASCERANVLPNTNAQNWWNNRIAPDLRIIAATAATMIEIDNPPPSLRWRISGLVPGYTMSIAYTIFYGEGPPGVESGPTPGLHK